MLKGQILTQAMLEGKLYRVKMQPVKQVKKVTLADQALRAPHKTSSGCCGMLGWDTPAW